MSLYVFTSYLSRKMVVFQGRVVKLPCDPGKEGAEAFKRQVRHIFNLAESVHLDVTFELKVPSSSLDQTMQKVYLKGFHTFQAASTVAAVCASKRTLHTNNHSRPRHYLDYSDVIPAHRSRDQQQRSPAQQPSAPAASWP
ncbi:hypothetical protein CEUSTIGMA_g5949.t1 [Chlamydomonas eustigma]|uniref:Uncharacterized protein n=1 Tax=Chlamydomonas eustigma TaxID=1157962 RepID=A0A250X6Y2_9CHLO|nr:hypothetical protein CEUSTIGMA_g5949.t1 [Chlamydomonas eustigma]|eukprot:GAX78510.1 hypothetical protein CEUSTIGMA_g5949.t1 [Chlamydomonas eustigma]